MSSISGCHVMAKPASNACNLSCEYCFYLDKSSLEPRPHQRWKMTSETLELYVKQYIEAQDGPIVEFTWQGGEPSMRGLPFFQEAVALAEKYRAGKTVNHSFQTNGVGLTEEWIRFFADNDVLIGLSIDGPQPVHDTYRVSRSGLGSYEQVVSTLALLKRFGVRFNVLTVVGEHNFNRGQEVYEHLRELGARHIQFIPLVERIQKDNGDLKLCHPNESSVDVAPFSVTAQGFGQFLCDVFDIWVRNDVGSVFVQAFDATLASWCGKPSGICVHSPECGHALALEANGDLFQCDHYVYPEYKLGNIHHQTIRQLNTSQQAVEFGVARSSAMNRTCRNCFFSFACHGGCPKHRFTVSSEGLPHHNYLCSGYQLYYSHTTPFMKIMRDLLMAKRAPAEIMPFLNSHYPLSGSK